MPITIYGIKNCDTMKKARVWLEKKGADCVFHDSTGWETLLNKAGTTFKKLPEKDKEGLTEAKAIKLMLAQPSMIKRPVLELGGARILVGFKPDAYEAVLA